MTVIEELTHSLSMFFQHVHDNWLTYLIICAPTIIVIIILVFRQVNAEDKEYQRIKEQEKEMMTDD